MLADFERVPGGHLPHYRSLCEAVWRCLQVTSSETLRDPQGVVHFRHTISISAVSFGWFGDFVAAFHDGVENLRFDEGRLVSDTPGTEEIRLVEGRHVGPGARYQLGNGDEPAPELVVRSWDRTMETCADVVSRDDNGELACTLKLRSVATPRAAEIAGTYRGGAGRRGLRQGSWSAQVDLEQWWEQADGRRRGDSAAPLTATFTHRYALGRLSVTPQPADEGNWRVTVNLRARGRSWLRPLVAVVLLLGLRRSLSHGFRKALDEMAADWNDDVTDMLREDPRQAAAAALESFLTDPRVAMFSTERARMEQWERDRDDEP
jgi:hypothetical protein